MTSSFTNMYLATLLCFSLDHYDETVAAVNEVIGAAKNLLKRLVYYQEFDDAFDYGRIVYLGTNTLKGIAQESALKMLELNAGKIVTMYDTPLGFRHGPKSIIDNTTLTVLLSF